MCVCACGKQCIAFPIKGMTDWCSVAKMTETSKMKTSEPVKDSVSIQITKIPAGKESIRKSVLATFVAALGPLSFGFSLSFSSPVLVDLEESTTEIPSLRFNSEEASWFSVRKLHLRSLSFVKHIQNWPLTSQIVRRNASTNLFFFFFFVAAVSSSAANQCHLNHLNLKQ